MRAAPFTDLSGRRSATPRSRVRENHTFFRPRTLLCSGSLAISGLHSHLLPPKFDRDAQVIQNLLAKPGLVRYEDYGSFATITSVYHALGLANSPTLAGFFGVIIAHCAFAVVLWRMRPIRVTAFSVGALVLYSLLVGVYQGVYTKEIIISAVVIVVAAVPTGIQSAWIWDCVLAAVMAALGHYFRPYWVLIAVFFFGLRLFVSNTALSRWWITTRRFILLLLACSLVASLVIVARGFPADHYRTLVNAGRGADTGSLIGRFIEHPEPIAGIVNVVLSTVMLMFPVTLAAKLSSYYLVIFVVIASFWATYFHAVRQWLRSDHRPPLVGRAVCLIAAFAVVQGLFEPDYGSALRHLTLLIPLFFIVAAGERGTERVAERGDAGRGVASPPLPTPTQLSPPSHPPSASNRPCDHPSARQSES
ncbi:MAG: hypothetical protein DI525_07540 [Corynebacterium kroppenstedtii]|uniref:Uncharacterized protein n=1 Tax=Corynebacterium kroppenstedtii TaxID=161879 RepID=A0A2W5SRH9_9CORY|nr:MAG: hypothetical protein DI525_07540 [Corynebacterium kroppenstedtii]